jgi:hypothetical protein
LIKRRDRAFVEKGARQEGKPMELTDPVKRILYNYESDNPDTLQRPKAEALDMLGKIIKIYQGRD